MRSGSPCTVKGTVEVSLDDISVVGNLSINHGPLGPRNARVGDHDIQSPIQVFYCQVYGILDSLRVLDIDLIRFA
jgi:hypothetical protein